MATFESTLKNVQVLYVIVDVFGDVQFYLEELTDKHGNKINAIVSFDDLNRLEEQHLYFNEMEATTDFFQLFADKYQESEEHHLLTWEVYMEQSNKPTHDMDGTFYK